jgi:predicted alpha/beta hydrolase
MRVRKPLLLARRFGCPEGIGVGWGVPQLRAREVVIGFLLCGLRMKVCKTSFRRQRVSETVRIKASDGHELDAYVARPSDESIAGLVVIQEAFGVNRHIRSVADSYAKDGFLAIAPAFFDRIERDVELGYEGADRQRGIALARQSNPADAMADVAAALGYLRKCTSQKCGVIGYCFGGTMA